MYKSVFAKLCKYTIFKSRLEITKKVIDISRNLWYDIVRESEKVIHYLRFRRDQIEIYN